MADYIATCTFPFHIYNKTLRCVGDVSNIVGSDLPSLPAATQITSYVASCSTAFRSSSSRIICDSDFASYSVSDLLKSPKGYLVGCSQNFTKTRNHVLCGSVSTSSASDLVGQLTQTQDTASEFLIAAEQYESLYALYFSLGLMIIFALGWIAGHQR